MNKYLKTDLACETPHINYHTKEDGVIVYKKEFCGIEAIYTEIISKRAELKTGRKIGKYATLCAGNVWKYTKGEKKKIISALKLVIYDFLFEANPENIIVVGLGNRNITSDSLGPSVIDKMFPTRHLKDTYPHIFKKLGSCQISLLAPGVIGQSGISAFDKVSLLKEKIKSDLIIAIDSLSSISKHRLCTTIQISNSGILPGSGLNSDSEEISRQTLGVPVISIGVPTVISASSLVYSLLKENSKINEEDIFAYESYFVSPNNCDEAIKHMSDIIAEALQSLLGNEKN